MKDERLVKASKRNAEGEVMHVHRRFEDDRMIRLERVKFLRNFLPGIFNSKVEKRLGITDAKPDYVFGIREDRFPEPGSMPGNDIKAIIGGAPGIIHPWFVIESKGCEGTLGESQNQAIRDGAAMVNAR